MAVKGTGARYEVVNFRRVRAHDNPGNGMFHAPCSQIPRNGASLGGNHPKRGQMVRPCFRHSDGVPYESCTPARAGGVSKLPKFPYFEGL